jgi:hypothetical protein
MNMYMYIHIYMHTPLFHPALKLSILYVELPLLESRMEIFENRCEKNYFQISSTNGRKKSLGKGNRRTEVQQISLKVVYYQILFIINL